MDCDKCIFAQYGQLTDIQVGCECGRVETFKDRGEAFQTVSQPFYQLTKFCNMYRTEDWVGVENYGREASVARDEVMPLFGIAVWDHDGATFDDLDKTVMGLSQMVYPKHKMKMMVSTFQSRGVAAVSDLINRVQATEFSRAVATFHLHENTALRDTEIFKKLIQGTFFVHVEAGYLLPPDLFEVIDNSMNGRLERIVMWEGEGWNVINKKVATSLYLKFNDYTKMVDYARGIAREQNVYQKV